MKEVEVGDVVHWTIENALFTKKCSGRVVKTGLHKFGHTDVMKVEVLSSSGGLQTEDTNDESVYVRPSDLD